MLSNLDIFSDAQAITETAVSTNALNVGEFVGRGEPIPLFIKVNTDFATLTSLTVSATFAATEGGTYYPHLSTAAVVLASLVKGYQFPMQYVPAVEVKDIPWMKLLYTVGGSNATAGNITAALSPGEDWIPKDGLFFSGTNSSGDMATA